MANELTKFTLDGTELDIVDTTARSSASSAQETANTAKTNAEKAQTTANTAKTNADKAQTTANTANTTATNALEKAGTNESSITTIKGTKVVKTAVYTASTKTLAITTGNIG